MTARPTVGLALGAGGARGFAHLGVLRVLERERIPVDLAAGTSIGALVGAAYASGRAANEVEALLRDCFTPEAVRRLFSFDPAGARPTDTTETGALALAAILRRVVGDRTFDDLALPLLVVATDLEARREAVFSRGGLVEALLASSAQPGAFPPVEVGGRGYVDGVVAAPVPTAALAAAGADLIVGVNLYGREDLPCWPADAPEPIDPAPFRIPRLLDSLFRMQDRQQVDLGERLMARADVAIVPCFGPSTWRDFHRADQFVAAGEAAAEAALPQLRSLLSVIAPPVDG